MECLTLTHMECLPDVMRGIIESLVHISEAAVDHTLHPTMFQSATLPGISIVDYVARLQKYAKFKAHDFVVALLYVKRMMLSHPQIRFTDLTVHRMLIAVLLVATKMFRDIHFSNRYYAKVGGMTTRELARLERCTLGLLDFKLYVSTEEFESERQRWMSTEEEKVNDESTITCN